MPEATRYSARSMAAAYGLSADWAIRSVSNSIVAIMPSSANSVSRTVSQESKSGSLSSWRSLL